MIKVTVVEYIGASEIESTGLLDPESVSCIVEVKDQLTRIYFDNHYIFIRESLDWLKKQAPSLFY